MDKDKYKSETPVRECEIKSNSTEQKPRIFITESAEKHKNYTKRNFNKPRGLTTHQHFFMRKHYGHMLRKKKGNEKTQDMVFLHILNQRCFPLISRLK